MISNGIIPLALGDLLFKAKARNSLAFGQWLWGIFPCTRKLFNVAYEGWAKCLLGSDTWRSAAVARGEMGWSISGAAFTIIAAARKCAKL